jgi:aminopeptidase N
MISPLHSGTVRAALTVLALLSAAVDVRAQTALPLSPKVFSHADTLRGSNGPARAWWDAQFYDLHVTVNPQDSTIRGWNAITYRVLAQAPSREMQIDLQVPMQVDSIVQDRRALTFRRDSNAFFVEVLPSEAVGSTRTIAVYYHGKPRVARRAPWDGGYVWQRDSLGGLWIATANEGLGASVWWPNKDLPADEPDSQRVSITVPDPIVDVSNGRLRSTTHNANSTTTYEWFVRNPINNYDVAVNAARYAHLSDSYAGERGTLTLDFWPLAYHADTARVQFAQVKPMLQCFEHWFGPYPWYDDGFKLVETPHLGMEHQSAVAYGNRFKNGYLGRDLSRTGWGLKWDFIIVHESAHEWWGNNISAKDHADMWLHESFANYAEGIYTECHDGKQAGAEYIIGSRKNIQNDEPIVGNFGVNDEGSGDMYYKGGSLLHTIRQLVDNDEKWRAILRGLNATFWHQTVSGAQVQDYIMRQAGLDLSKIFEQYLQTTKVPALEYRMANGGLSYRWTNVVSGFAMPVRVALPGAAPNVYTWIRPTESWSMTSLATGAAGALHVDPNFYVDVRVAP